MLTWRTITDFAKRNPRALHLADRLGRGHGRLRWIDRLISKTLPAPHTPDLRPFHQATLAATWVGHATVLLRVGGKNILTDPVFSLRVGLGLGFATGGPSRLVAPALRLRDLPRIDLIAISHAHFDHLDIPTLARLPRSTPVVTADGTADLLRHLGFTTVREMPWGERFDTADLRVTSVPVRHWGARVFHDDHRDACAYLFESAGRRVLFGGDTAYCDHFKSIGRVDLAVLGIGAYNPWEAGHATPEQAWRMADHASADFVLPMHHSTFRLGREPMDEPLRRLHDVAGRGWDRVVAREIGQTWSLN